MQYEYIYTKEIYLFLTPLKVSGFHQDKKTRSALQIFLAFP